MADCQNAAKTVSSCNEDLCILPLAAQNFFLNTYLAHFLLKCQRELITEAFFVGPENKFRITLKKTNMSSVYCDCVLYTRK